MGARSIRFRVLAAIVSATVTVTTLVAGASPATAGGGPSTPRLTWRACATGPAEAQCATAAVPLDYDRPGGPTIDIALARIPATDPARRLGTVFINPGGPGGSGVQMALGGFGESLRDNLDGRFDVVGFDPRGVGASAPLRCFENAEERDRYLAEFEVVFPYRFEQERPYFETYRELPRRCFARDPVIARHMSTADVARDLDLLRRAVGDPRLTYLGFSYGSYLGNTYANLFPRRIRALAIDGVLDPRLWSSGWQIKSDRVATQEEFEEFLRLCDEAGRACAFAAPGGSRARWERLARSLRARPVTLPDGSVYRYDLLIADAASAMYAPEVWGGPEGFAVLLDLVADAVLGDQGAAAGVASVRSRLLDRLRPVRQEPYDNSFEAYYGNQCADTEYPRSFAAFHVIGRYAEAGSRFGPFWWWWNAGCADWPVAPDRYVGPWTARTSAPVLVVGNYFDGVTDYAGARATARLLRNSRLLSYAGWGHTAYGRSACVTAHVDRYLLTGAPPPRGTVCPANPNPFLTAVAQRAADAARPVLPPPWRARD
jgi:pimeloyl-ACP methyl ester carboxylesterase